MFDLNQSPQMELLRLHPVSLVVRLQDQATFRQVYRNLRTTWLRPPTPARDLGVFALTAELIGLLLQSWQAAGCPPRPAGVGGDGGLP